MASLLAVSSGCKKKQPAVPQPQSQAPTIAQPEAQPQPQPAPQPTAPEATSQPESGNTPSTSTTTATTKAKPKTKKHPATGTAKKAESKPESNKPAKVVVPESSPETNTTLSANIPQDEAQRQRQSTAQLIQVTEHNLSGLTRTLSADEQSMLVQIRSFEKQSRAADADGDLERAYNLALKAKLLSDELVKR